MKKVKQIFLLAITVSLLSACNNVEKILPKKDGTWNIKENTVKFYIDGVLDDEQAYINYGKFTFNDDGTGTYEYDHDSGVFTWSFNKDKDEITVIADGAAITYEVLESKKDEQEWYTSIEEVDSGTTYRTEQTLKLERVD